MHDRPRAPEGVQQRLVQQPVDVLDVIVRLVRALDLLLGLTRMNTLENAYAPAVHTFGRYRGDNRTTLTGHPLQESHHPRAQKWL
jgi:hypothetical protein